MFGLRISQPGKSVKSSNLLDQNVDNKLDFLKAFKQGTASVNITASGTYTVDITHGLGYYPFFIYYVAPDPNNPDRKFFGNSGASGIHGSIANEAIATKEILRFGWINSGTGWAPFPYKVTFYYYIFYDALE